MIFEASLKRHKLYLSVVNWAEIYYNTMREASVAEAEKRVREIETLFIEIIEVGTDLNLSRVAAQFKARYRISLAGVHLPPPSRKKRVLSSSPVIRNSKRSKRKSKLPG